MTTMKHERFQSSLQTMGRMRGKVERIDPEGGYIIILQGKENKRRIYLSEKLMEGVAVGQDVNFSVRKGKNGIGWQGQERYSEF